MFARFVLITSHLLFMKQNILITGASGFIGKNLVEQLSDSYTIFSPRSTELDLLNQDAVESYLKKNSIDQVIHAAVYHVTRNSGKDPLQGLSHNLRMFFNLARCNNLYKKMIYFGSGAEYGKQRAICSVTEEDFGDVIPSDEYGLYKYALTKMLPSYKNIYNLRLFGIFGKYEDWHIRFISNAICKTMFGMDITMKKNVYFDYMYINDLIPLIKKSLELEKLPHNVMNVCTGKRTDLYSLAHIIQKVGKATNQITVGDEGFSNEYTASNLLLLKSFPSLKFTPLEEAIKELYSWYVHNKSQIDPRLLQEDP